jgi:hypothetical protein
MALEQAGGSSLNKLIKKIKEKYPDYNFDIPPAPDTKCKSKYDCQGLKNIAYKDREGNIFCGKRYKEASEDDPYTWSYKECHALLQKARQGGEQDGLPF